MNESDKQKEYLELMLTRAAMNLTGHTKTSTLVVPVPNTDPVVYVAVGEVGKIKSKIDYLAAK